MKELAALLDGLAHEARVAWVRSVGRRDQRRLYEAAAGFLPLALADLVPPSRADEATVRHWLEGNICRCTGYQNIVASIQAGARAMAKEGA